ncbi:MAG: ABC transporter ATP-binding protein/permease [Pirellulales bacterium]|nr:ABC transporter ATP-binding protein/permease [Pirellulales bacterium]
MATPWFDRARRFGRPAPASQILVYFLGGFAGLCAVASVLVLGMLVDLMFTRGALEVAPEAAPVLERLCGASPTREGIVAQFTDTGLLPLVWQARNTWYGPFLTGMYQRLTWLHHNKAALWTLIAAGMAGTTLAGFALVWHEWLCRAAAQITARRLRAALRLQVFRVGACELPGPREPRPAELIHEKTELVRQGLADRWLVESRVVLWTPLFLLSVLLTQFWVGLAAILLLVVVWRSLTALERRVFLPRAAIWRDRLGREMTTLLDAMRQVRLVRGFGLTDTPGEPFERTLDRLETAGLRRDWLEMLGPPLGLTALVVTGWAVVAIAAVNVLREPPRMSAASCVTTSISLLCAAWPLARIRRARRSARRAEPSARAIFNYLDREPTVAQRADARPLSPLGQSLRFEQVRLVDRGDRVVISDATFEIAAGKRLAILATDDDAAMALACLAVRFHDPRAGRVLIDGVDIRQTTLDSLRAQVGLVLQQGFLFTGTIEDNIICGDSRYGLLQATEAAKQAQAYNFIQRLPQGFATVVGEFGVRLDAWEVFRIGLARALLRDPALLILEEPVAPIDTSTSEMIDHVLEHTLRERTAVLIPSRMATLRDADQIVLVDGGRLIDQGTHAELLHRSALYRHVLYQRFSNPNGSA